MSWVVKLGGNPLGLHCRPAWSNWSNWSNWVIELGGNPLRLHCMPARSNQSNWASSQWISTQFDHPNQPIWPGIISLDFHPIQPANSTDLTRHYLNELGGWIGWKSIEITLYACLVKLGGNPLGLHCMPAWSNRSNWVVELVKLGIISMDFHPIWPIWPGIISMDFHPIWPIWPPNSTSQFDWFNQASSQWIGWLNWVEIHWDYIVCLPGRIGQIGWLNWSNWASSQWISTQFDRFNQPSSQWKINTKLHNTSEVDLTSKSTSFIKLLHFWVFQYFLSSKSTFMTCPQTGRLQF